MASYTAFRWVLAFFLFVTLKNSPVPLAKMVKVFLLGLGVHAVIGLVQFLIRSPIGIPGEMALETSHYQAPIISVAGVRWLRAYGLTFHPNVLGGFLVVGLLLSLPLLNQHWVRVLWWFLGVGLFLSFSRSAWLVIAILLPLIIGWLVWKVPEIRRSLVIVLVIAGILGLIGAGLFGPLIIKRLNMTGVGSNRSSIRERGLLMVVALETVISNPITGVGAGNFPLVILFHDPPIAVKPHYVHNIPLLLAAETGIAAIVLWFWLWLAPTSILEKLVKEKRLWAIAILAAWFAIGAIGLWDFYPWALESGRLLTVTLLAWLAQCLPVGKLPQNHA